MDISIRNKPLFLCISLLTDPARHSGSQKDSPVTMDDDFCRTGEVEETRLLGDRLLAELLWTVHVFPGH